MKPVLFMLPGLETQIRAYAFFLALAFVLGWAMALRLARADGLDEQRVGPVFVVSAVAGLVGARVGWALANPGALEGAVSWVSLRAGTLAPVAGVAVALIVSGAWVRREGIAVWAWYDTLAPALALGVTLERIGAFFAGAGFGRVAAAGLPSVRFPPGSPAFEHHQRALAGLMPSGATGSLPVHPTQLYAAALGLGGLVLCVWLRRRRRFTGEVFVAYAAYAIAARALVEEFLRADAPVSLLGPLNAAQLRGVAMIAGLAGTYAYRHSRGRTRVTSSKRRGLR